MPKSPRDQAEPPSRRSKVTPEQRLEADRLRALYRERVEGRMSQDAFGHQHGLGNQSNVGHYLHGRQSLNAIAALKFARGLECHVEDFSERLAAEIDELASLAAADRGRRIPEERRAASTLGGWPFPIDPALFGNLSPEQLARIAGAMSYVLHEIRGDCGNDSKRA